MHLEGLTTCWWSCAIPAAGHSPVPFCSTAGSHEDDCRTVPSANNGRRSTRFLVNSQQQRMRDVDGTWVLNPATPDGMGRFGRAFCAWRGMIGGVTRRWPRSCSDSTVCRLGKKPITLQLQDSSDALAPDQDGSAPATGIRPPQSRQGQGVSLSGRQGRHRGVLRTVSALRIPHLVKGSPPSPPQTAYLPDRLRLISKAR